MRENEECSQAAVARRGVEEVNVAPLPRLDNVAQFEACEVFVTELLGHHEALGLQLK